MQIYYAGVFRSRLAVTGSFIRKRPVYLKIMDSLVERTEQFAFECGRLSFSFDGYVYNPLIYAWNNHRAYLERYVKSTARVIFLGMNPGPFGMMQTGVPFGEINAVKNYLKLTEPVGRPEREHPGRPVEGLNIRRSEVSGRRLWGLVQSRYPDSDAFAEQHAVMNYCPLGFLSAEKTARNITPDKLLHEERKNLERLCNSYLKDIISLLQPEILIGVGRYAEEKLKEVSSLPVRSIIHPSPGNPQANNGWAEKISETLENLGVWGRSA